MDGKRKTALFTAAFFVLALALLVGTFAMQLSLRRTLDAAPAAAQTAPQTVTDAPQVFTDAPQQSPAVQTQPVRPTEAAREEPLTVRKAPTTAAPANTTETRAETLSETLVVNTSSKKIHSPDCAYVRNMDAKNRREISASALSEYLADGYELCAHCEGYAS